MSSKEERKNYLKKELIRIETKIKKLQEKKKKIKDEYKNLVMLSGDTRQHY